MKSNPRYFQGRKKCNYFSCFAIEIRDKQNLWTFVEVWFYFLSKKLMYVCNYERYKTLAH